MTSTNNPASSAIEDLTARIQELISTVYQNAAGISGIDANTIGLAMAKDMARDPRRWQEIFESHYQRHLDLLRNLGEAAQTGTMKHAVTPDPGDRRFTAPEWDALPWFSYLKQAYLLNARTAHALLDALTLSARDRRKFSFYARQVLDAMAPSNFANTNPDVLALTSANAGKNLERGLELLAADLKKGRITTTDESAFEIERNIATTPGAIIFENDIIQLIQYRPSTDTVHERPLIIVPPCINKYYVLDLQPDNSFVRYAVSQGHTVFMVSWRNASEAQGRVTWDEYVESGVITAIQVARDICATKRVNTLGFCVGGTLLASALAVLAARKSAVAGSLTLLASMLDFSDTGDISVFVDEAYVLEREKEFAHGGLMKGKQLAATFSSLRPNDLIWNYVVNSYLKGKAPPAFDLLYWNSDSTNLPGAMFAYYIRNMYLENRLREPGRLTMCGAPVDLGKIKVPSYILASRDDHIVPWQTAFQSVELLGGRAEFVLAASGHIAGVINPASGNKRSHWLGASPESGPQQWLGQAREYPGSWWPHWSRWLAKRGGPRVDARSTPGSARYPVIEAAPGRYVKVRSD